MSVWFLLGVWVALLDVCLVLLGFVVVLGFAWFCLLLFGFDCLCLVSVWCCLMLLGFVLCWLDWCLVFAWLSFGFKLVLRGCSLAVAWLLIGFAWFVLGVVWLCLVSLCFALRGVAWFLVGRAWFVFGL